MNTAIQNKIRRKLNNGATINSIMIEELIADHSPIAEKTLGLWKRYKGEVPIKHRELPEYVTNEKIANDFFGSIVNQKVGYFAGIPINYDLDKTKYEVGKDESNEEVRKALNTTSLGQYKKHAETINDFILRNNMHDLDSEMTKILAVCGHAGRKMYIDKNGFERVVNVKPYETIFLLNEHKEVEYALRYYIEYNIDDELVTHVEFYDGSQVFYFVENSQDTKSEGEKFVLNIAGYPDNPKMHLFDYCPFVFFQNNEESQSDLEKVLDLIDNYDTVLSNNSNELNGFLLAYMYFEGEMPDEKVMEQVKKIGAFHIPVGSKIGYVTKQLDPTFGDSFLDRVEGNIQRFSQSVDFLDESFGNISGIALQYKLQALSNKSISLESKFKRSLSEMMKIVTSTWEKRKVNVYYLDVFFTFKRNLPVDYEYEAKVTGLLQGKVSERTRLTLLSFIDDVEYELEEMKKDAEAYSVPYTDPNTPVDKEYNLDNLPKDE
ncbi:phage portal protein [Psychrobacillus sp. BM2]|uniref:phage portal protein n=1 Tax=Psychrobacillus sp. BM2 TaxID=3400421 RepID=UPI003B02416C